MQDPFDTSSKLDTPTGGKKLEWHESALNDHGYVEGFLDAERSTPKLLWLRVFLLLCFGLLVVKIFQLQIINGGKYRALSENNRIRSQTILAPRGLIKDRYGEVLAENTASYNLQAVPFDLPRAGLEDEVIKLSQSFGLDPAKVMAKLKNVDRNSFEPIIIKQDLSLDQSILFETRSSEFLGFSVNKLPIRQYPEPEVFSHLIGYAGLISPEDQQHLDPQNYDANDFIGKAGVELQYENYLHGVNGQDQLEVDATGKLVQVLGQKEAVSGDNLVLNIDKQLQEKLYQGLISKGRNVKGAVLAMNPKNGEVLAFLSLPGFDNNLFAHGITQDEYGKLVQNKNLPLFDRAIAGTYPPGSTVKPMVAAAALQEQVVDENTVVVDRGVLVITNQYDPKQNYNFYGWQRSGLGSMTVRSAIAQSSDIYFYTVAGGGNPKSPVVGLGAEKLASYYRNFNLGKTTGIDLPGEKPGLVPDPEWKASYYKNDPILSKWYLGDTYHIGIGQGDVLATPLQVAEWTSIIANNGVGFKPRILNVVLGGDGKVVYQSKPEVSASKFISDQNLKIVQEGMRDAVLEGSGRLLRDLPISAAGKTGTSQFDGSDPSRTHAWFTAYAPYEDPQIVITVLVEAGGEGHLASEPVVRDALLWWAQNRYKK